jgi:excisionase family DNA binding protein
MVYFIQSVDGGPIKIGYADDPEKRLAEIQRMSPTQLCILNIVDGDRKCEGFIHRCFKKLRLHGEWFEPGDKLVDFVNNPNVTELKKKREAEKQAELRRKEARKRERELRKKQKKRTSPNKPKKLAVTDVEPLESAPFNEGQTSTAGAAAYLDVTIYTILRLIKRGSIKAERFFGGGPWLIDKESVIEYKKRNAGKGPNDPTRE